MSDFFGSLNSGNVRFTDARINGDGPLPTNLSGPEGINGDPDGRYNFNDSLLSGILPYAYGQGRMGADRNYQQIPHRKQFPVPQLFLPDSAPFTTQCLQMSHPIDMGDLVFIINAKKMKHFLFTGSMAASIQDKADTSMPNYNLFCNLCTANYILGGLSNFFLGTAQIILTYGPEAFDLSYACNEKEFAWLNLVKCFGIEDHYESMKTQLKSCKNNSLNKSWKDWLHAYVFLKVKYILRQVIRDIIKPFGICSTSEKQGGQHEVGWKPVQAAANFYVTLTVDGQNRDLVNVWNNINVEGGEQLTLELEWCTANAANYVLNHYYKGYIKKHMSFALDHKESETKGRFQLMPKSLRLMPKNQIEYKKPDDDVLIKSFVEKSKAHFPLNDSNSEQKDEIWERVDKSLQYNISLPDDFGCWHIGQAYTHIKRNGNGGPPIDDTNNQMRGPLLQVNFAPVWTGKTLGEFGGGVWQLVHFMPTMSSVVSEVMFALASFKAKEIEKKFEEMLKTLQKHVMEIYTEMPITTTCLNLTEPEEHNLTISKNTFIEISNPAKRYKKTSKNESVEQTEWDFEKELNLEFGQVENLAASRDFEKELNLQVEAGANSVVSQNFEKELNLQGQAGPSQSQHKGKKKN